MQTSLRLVLLAAVSVTCLVAGQNSMRHNLLRGRYGVLPDAHLNKPPYRKFAPEDDNKFESDEVIPESFDAREKWPKCPTIREIYNQGQCGSCWAAGAATTISDRLCIHSKGDITTQVSVENLLSCCGSFCGLGCDGGDHYNAWKFWITDGLVSGGGYGSNQGCQPYTINDWEENQPTPECYPTCEDRNYTVCYNKDKTFGMKTYAVKPEDIQQEIMMNGPVQASFTVYEDFGEHNSWDKSKIYGKKEAGHSVRLLGWGVENGTDYWLAANSWGGDWGENGFFKILRGVDYCGIEKNVVAGLPKV